MTHQAGINRSSTARIAFALFAALAMFMVFAFSSARLVYADGDGSPAECLDGDNVQGSIGGTDDEATATAPAGQVVTGVCIKSGQLHTGPLTDVDSNDCYKIEGVGTNEATVTRLLDSSECQAISHIDAVFGSAPGDDDDDDDDDDGTAGGNPPAGEGTAGGNPPPDTAMTPAADNVLALLVALVALAALGGLTALRLSRRPE